MLAALAITVALQTAQQESRLFCIADPATGDVEVTLLFRRAEGGPWRTYDRSREGEIVDLDGLPRGEGRDWFDGREPIVHDGVIYQPGGDGFSVGGAVNRYLRHVGLHKGAPLFSVWPGGDIDLAVLQRAEGCVFRVYAREDRPGT